jgi:hypothetical protein
MGYDTDGAAVWDEGFLQRLINYQVVKITPGGVPTYTDKDEHTVDACFLSLLAAAEKYDDIHQVTFTSAMVQRSIGDTNLLSGKAQPSDTHVASKSITQMDPMQRWAPVAMPTLQHQFARNGFMAPARKQVAGSGGRRSF